MAAVACRGPQTHSSRSGIGRLGPWLGLWGAAHPTLGGSGRPVEALYHPVVQMRRLTSTAVSEPGWTVGLKAASSWAPGTLPTGPSCPSGLLPPGHPPGGGQGDH